MRVKVSGLIIGGFLCLGLFSLFSKDHVATQGDVMSAIPASKGTVVAGNTKEFVFHHPIDAASLRSSKDETDLLLRAETSDGWTEWEALQIEKEFDPVLRETNLVMFPESIRKIQIRGSDDAYIVHAIRVSDEPIHTQIAAAGRVGLTPSRVISRREWGANEELLYVDYDHRETERSDVGDNGSAVTGESGGGRIDECTRMQQEHPDEFRVSTTLKKGPNGREYRWPVSYSKDVNMLVVHHTAMKATGDTRTGLERMRALYSYHSINRGWGDIGYNFVIDENGAIYEGKEGGSYVVAGHAYCNNIGTVGIALMGNFDTEQPPQKQMESLKRLLDDLATEYDIDLTKSVTYHGKTYASPVVGHGDLLSTDCPGYYVKETMGQIRRQVIAGNFAEAISFPALPTSKPPTRVTSTPSRTRVVTRSIDGLQANGSTSLQMSPGSRQRFTISYTAPSNGLRARSRLGQIKFSDRSIGLWLETGDGNPRKLSNTLVLLDRLKANEHVGIPLLLQAPDEGGDYWFEIGGIRYALTVQGRRSRVTDSTRIPEGQVSQGLIREGVPLRPSRGLSSSSSSARPTVPTRSDHTIRVLLTAISDPAISFGSQTTRFTANGNRCEATINGMKQSSSALRIENVGLIRLSGGGKERIYRGTIECRIENGIPIIINELPLEEYLMGLAEEPDTEPYEKQRAFAIAARSYAMYYLDPNQRKFPGKPYDGSDSPATFQAYAGYTFEQNNPRWLQARESTEGMVLTVQSKVIKVPYFSSNDGRTRSPAEVGWKNFPHAEIFASKPDPWCQGMENRGHGVGMSGCGSEAQANEGKTGEEILGYYYPGATIQAL